MEQRSKSLKTLSTLISRSLCIDGVNKFSSELAKSRALIMQCLSASRYKKLESIKGGSSAEGTMTSDSDVDSMFVIPDITVEISLETAKTNEPNAHVFLFHTFESQPGYGRLRLLRLSETGKSFFEASKADIRDLLVHTVDGEFLSSDKFVNYFMSRPTPQKVYRNGPCSSFSHAFVHNVTEEKPEKPAETDIVYALQCVDWPVEAKEWTTRKREWPQQDLVKKIACTKCYVVPVGNPLSKHHAHEWRMSFILGERELVWSFNETQLQCYVILKVLLKVVHETIARDLISSYHIKTVVFWISEENGLDIWQPENFLGCVKSCLEKLKDCVSKKELRHYFNCQVNLFGHKFENELQRRMVFTQIDNIKADVDSYVLKHIAPTWQWASVSERFWADTDNLQKFIKDAKVLVGSDFSTAVKARNVRNRHKTLFEILKSVITDDSTVDIMLDQFIAFMCNPPEAVDILLINMTQQYLGLKVEMTYLTEMALHENEAFLRYTKSVQAYPEAMIGIASRVCEIDALSGYLYLASLLLTLREYSKSLEITQKILQQHKHLVYTGYCSKYNSILLQTNGVSIQEIGTKFDSKEEETFGAFDMIFYYKDVYCVPYPVKFECTLAHFDLTCDNFVAIHPSVYAYFLLFYGQYLSKQHSTFNKTLDLFQKTVLDTKGCHERYHGLNLLAFCYLLNGNLRKAFELFKESIYETQTLSYGKVQNAAAYYIAIVLNEIRQRKILAQGSYINKRSHAIEK